MTGRQIFHTAIFIILGIVALYDARFTKRGRRYLNLAIGILALSIAIYDILHYGLGVV